MEKKNDKIKWVVAFALIAVLFLGFVGMSVKLLHKDKHIAGNTVDSTQSGFIISETEGSGISLMSATISEEEFSANGVSELAESAVTIKATVTPSDATYKQVDWTAEFADVSGWAAGKSVSDYVTITPASDGALTATAECKQAFGEQIVITVTSRSNSEAHASCTCHYVKRVESVDLKLTKGGNATTTLALGDGETYTAVITPNYTAGTITPQVTTDYVLELNSNYWNNRNTGKMGQLLYGATITSYSFTSSFTSTEKFYSNLVHRNATGGFLLESKLLAAFVDCVNMRTPDNNQAVLRATYSVTYNGAEIESGSKKIDLSFDVSNLEVAVSGVNVNTPTITW